MSTEQQVGDLKPFLVDLVSCPVGYGSCALSGMM